ncbi:MAG: VWA domain-containing protein [Proteobacteria bacterium]|nr:VWA domain-containing protein [Pseudomonadota bacterium]MDA1331053.1 VWA domain-containing protein [Pseudomonadota bacterium]
MITFFASSPLFSFLLFGLIAAVILLYLLRPPLLNRVISSNLIWKRVIGSSRLISERWRWWLSLLLALFIAICLLSAALRPSVDGQADDRTLIILDNSPSMEALTQSGLSRYNVAKDSVMKLLASLSKDVQVMLVDTQRQITTPSFSSVSDALQILEQLEIGNSLEPLVPSQVATVDASKKFIYTDGVLIGGVPENFNLVSVFQSAPNVGITRLSFATVPGDAQRRQAFVEVVNAGSDSQLVEIELAQTQSRILRRRVDLGPHEKVTHIFDATKFDSGPVKAAVFSSADSFKADDTAFGYITEKKQVRVGLVANTQDSKLFTLLSLMPRVSVSQLTPAQYEALKPGERSFDAMVFDGIPSERKPTVPSIFFGVDSSNWLDISVTPIRSSQLSVEKNTVHPILRNISMSDLLVETAFVFGVSGGVDPLLEAEDGEILAIAVPGAIKNILFGFDLDKSNLTFLADFPILLSNSITWLVDEPPVLSANLGVVKLPGDVTKIYRIDGVDIPLWSADGKAYFHTQEAGLYTAFTPNGPLRVSVSQLDQRFSDINVSKLPSLESSQNIVNPRLRGYSFAFLAGVMTLILLMLDWYFYHRRITQ